MPRTATIEVTAASGALSNIAVWANHTLVADTAPPASWSGKIPVTAMPLTIEVNGVGASTYHVKITVDDQVITDTDRTLHGGFDAFHKQL